MLDPREEAFLQYWSAQRQRKKQFLRRLSVGLPVGAILAAAILLNLLSGWYERADMDLRTHSSVIVVVMVALFGVIVFITIFSAYHKWDQNEKAYHELKRKKEKQNEV